MSLEERTLETIGDRCEVCGAELTREELEDILEAGGPVLCQVHADEIVDVEGEDAEPEAG
jgi:hypothetical protein